MSGGVYGGDEVGALVFDAGHHSVRVGYAGEEFPKADLPSQIGVIERELTENGAAEAMDVDETKRSKTSSAAGGKTIRQYSIGTTQLAAPRELLEIDTFLKDGQIENWDMFEAMLDHCYANCLFTESKYNPVLFSEPAWNTKAKRETLIELMFEKYNVPAFFVCKNAVLSAFANGRSSGLVLDSGATHTSAVPVYDGYCLTQQVVKTPLGGNMLTDQCKMMLQEQHIEVVPSYKIASKIPVNENEPSKWTPKSKLPAVTKSYHDYMVQGVIEDLKASVFQLSDMPIDVETAEKLPAAPYEFPCGFSREFMSERVKIPEGLFDLAHIKNAHPQTLMTVAQVASTSIGMCDIDIRASLYSGLIVTGGNTLMPGFVERLNHDLVYKCPPSCKLRITAAPTPLERRYGAWIGGSILASLGSFQQMWVSRLDYDEAGKTIVEKKCP